MSKEFDYNIFIGRFQPLHLGHESVIKKALDISENLIIVLGGAFRPRTIRNPFTSKERETMIRNAFPNAGDRLIFIHQPDYMYNDDMWLKDIQEKVNKVILGHKWQAGPYRIGLIGHKKDNTSYYLDLFPTWKSVEVASFDDVNATQLRECWISEGLETFEKMGYDKLISNTVRDFLYDSNTLKEIRAPLKREYDFVKKYKKSWESAPYPPIFVTCDAIVVQSGHVLMVIRKDFPGEGLLALPGGFLNQNEFVADGIIRELKEETKIDVPEKVLRGSIVERRVFDHPMRSARGRTITNTAYFKLPAGKLPKVKGSDDAKKALWVPLGELKSEEIFEDHYDQIMAMVK